ncbi:MAG: hypothetical protein AB1846_04575 [Chloroflexota bacterium]
MLDIQTQLFDGQFIRLGQIDYDRDPEIESRWTHDSAFMRMLELAPPGPYRRSRSRNATKNSRNKSKKTRTCSTSPSATAKMTGWSAWQPSNGSSGPTATAS